MSDTISKTHARTYAPTSRLGHCLLLAALCAFSFVLALAARAQSRPDTPARIQYDETAHTFRMDAAGVSYVLGVNQSGELQTLYWGNACGPPIPFRRPTRMTAALHLICR